MEKNYKAEIILFPFIVTLLAISIYFIQGTFKAGLASFSFDWILLIFLGMLFIAIYLFTVISVIPLYIYLCKKIENKLISFILFNIIGFILIVCIDIWFLTIFDFKPLYLVFPLFSILSLISQTVKRERIRINGKK